MRGERTMKALSFLSAALLAIGWVWFSNSAARALNDEPHLANVRQLTQGGETHIFIAD